ncbi:MAG: hypothetical protein GX424_03340 [Clostridiales bacterium]|nr:hypothetical protein [Clostridiales bacterium]
MKWLDLTYSDFYIPYDENQKVIRGYWLSTLGINLEELPDCFQKPFYYYESSQEQKGTLKSQKVSLSEIVGTSHTDYGGMKIIESYMRLKRAPSYIKDGRVTRSKYFYQLKRPAHEQVAPVTLSRLDNGKYYIDSNGNHRIVFYQLMMLSEISTTYPLANAEDYNLRTFDNIKKRYWLNAMVKSV